MREDLVAARYVGFRYLWSIACIEVFSVMLKDAAINETDTAHVFLKPFDGD